MYHEIQLGRVETSQPPRRTVSILIMRLHIVIRHTARVLEYNFIKIPIGYNRGLKSLLRQNRVIRKKFKIMNIGWYKTIITGQEYISLINSNQYIRLGEQAHMDTRPVRRLELIESNYERTL